MFVLLIGAAQIIENITAQVAPKSHYFQRFDSTDNIFLNNFTFAFYLEFFFENSKKKKRKKICLLDFKPSTKVVPIT